MYNRIDPLRRALQSLADQTLEDFECVVVDDASTDPVKGVVAEFDHRFRYVRRDVNGGPTPAKLTAAEHVLGRFVTVLDSDNVFFPWALARAAYYFDRFPEADAAIGLYMFPEGLLVRVRPPVKLVGPDEFARRFSPWAGTDCLGTYRLSVAKEWLGLRQDYYRNENVFELMLRLSHSVVLVDEPWGRYDPSGDDRVSQRIDPREYEDMVKYVEEFRPIIGTSFCRPVDLTLIIWWQLLTRAGRFKEAAVISDWMRERGISRRAAVRYKIGWSLRRRLPSRGAPRVHVF